MHAAASVRLGPSPRLALDVGKPLSDEEMLAEIRRVAKLVTGRYYRCSLLAANSAVHYQMLFQRFGGWRKALAKAGVPHLYRPMRPSSWRKLRPRWRLTEADMLNELRRIAWVKGSNSISDRDIRRVGRHSPSLYDIHFGSWRMAAARAGLQTTQHFRPWTEAECIENLRRVWMHLRRPPRAHEMAKPPSTVGEYVYRRRWGGWTAALHAFVARINSTPDDPLHDAAREWAAPVAAKA